MPTEGVVDEAHSSVADATDDVAPYVAKNVEEIARIEGKDRLKLGLSDHFADLMTRFSGSMLFVWLHVAWFGVWILLNVIGVVDFDEFPFGFLTMIVSLEAIFLSTFVLISQNHQALQSDRRAKVDLQVNLVAEQEVTKLMSLVAEIHRHLGLGAAQDSELEGMQQRTRVDHLARAVDMAEEEARATVGANGSEPKH